MKKSASHFITSLISLCLLITELMVPYSASCQNDDRIYVQASFMKVKPGMYDEYVKLEREIWKPIHQERIKQGKITGWGFQEVIFPAGTDREYDFVVVNLVKGWKNIETMWDGIDEIAKKVLNKEQLVRMDKTEQTRDMIRVELWAVEDMVFRNANDGAPYKYMSIGYKDVPFGFGKWAEYTSMEKELAKPLHQQKINAGKMAGWSLEWLAWPYDVTKPGSVITIDFFDKWEDLQGSTFWEDLKKMHPNMDNDYLRRRVIESSKFYRNELRRLVDYAN
jgi:hypothetical protein